MHAVNLIDSLDAAQTAGDSIIQGYDQRRLLTIKLREKIQPEKVRRAVNNIELVSQEQDKLILAFASKEQLDEFQSRLRAFSNGHSITYEKIILSLSAIDIWTANDRMGWSLREKGFPNKETILLDITLWPLDKPTEARKMQDSFEQWIRENSGVIVDSVKKPYLILYRIRCSSKFAEQCLQYRDVRHVDLPPEVGLEQHVVFTSIQDLDMIPEPPAGSPGIVVLDSGVVPGHPVLAPAMGDSQSFLPNRSPWDSHGHGTFVCGIALYDDVSKSIHSRKFIPRLRLFSGRLLDGHNQGNPKLIENQVEEAVQYFTREYGCKVFNFSYGNRNKPYKGGHLSGLSVTLDMLSREYDILFVIPTGNRDFHPSPTGDLPSSDPEYFTADEAGLIDPSPALNVLTVGRIARYDKSQSAQDRLNARPAVRSRQPSPFTRHGPSINGAIKPEIVDYGGNLAVDSLTNRVRKDGLGELSISHEFSKRRPFCTDVGTSFSAPRVAHVAARILGEIPTASVDLCRAILVAHARIPQPCSDLFAQEGPLRSVVGYGLVDRTALYRSLENYVTLWIEEKIGKSQHHLFRIPIPEEFWSLPRRDRQLTVSLAYRTNVRNTRIDYRGEMIHFKLIQADSVNQILGSLGTSSTSQDVGTMSERSSGRSVTHRIRSKGTVQASTWSFRQPSSTVRSQEFYIVVTRWDPTWYRDYSREELPYALVTALSDRANQTSRLYTQVKAELQSRVRSRIEI